MRKLLKEHPRIMGLCALVLVLTAAALWYTRPVSFSQLTDGFDRGVPAAAAYARAFNDRGTARSVSGALELDGGDALTAGLLELFDAQTYRRRLTNLLPWSGSLGESTWQVVFGGDYALIVADDGGGIYLSHNTPDGESTGLRCSVSDAEQLRHTVFELLRSADPDREE